ncbi:MAG: ABC transporter ATP-binding protein [Acidobacteriota bacterium]
MPNVIEINALSKDYETGFWRKKKVRALDELSLSIEGGQIFGFLGGNGAGKTTTIKILMGLLFPSAGSARILGTDISDFKMHSKIGYCPENPYFYDYLTARELLNYFGELFGLDTGISKDRAEELLTAVGIDEKNRDKQLRKFSKGMLQRVGLAQALINDPEIVFFDEPMSGLDPVGRRDVRELIANLRQKGTTVFMSTHILSDVEALCDEVAVLRNGRLAASGKLSELLAGESESRSFEIIAAGVSADRMDGSRNWRVAAKSGGLAIEVDNENEIGQVLDAIKGSGGKLVSVNPVKQSLEEFFVSTPEEKSCEN